jgi:hypothetical protein
MSTTKKAAARTAKKQAAPSKEISTKAKKGESAKVYIILRLTINVVQILRIKQGFPYLRRPTTFLRCCY